MTWVAPKIMGVVNTTPDSFSDGGQFLELESALSHARLLVSQGATIIDVGGESTRPGAIRVTLEDEQARVIPVIKAIKAELEVEVSVDTMNAETAKLAVLAGADYVNDVSGGLADKTMFATIAPLGCKYILGHWRGHSNVMDQLTGYQDIAKDVVAELSEQVAMAVAAGIEDRQQGLRVQREAPRAVLEQTRQVAAGRAHAGGERYARKERGACCTDVRVGGHQLLLGLPDVGAADQQV